MDATACAFAGCAILLWSSLAATTVHLAGCDPLVICGLGLTISGLLASPTWRTWALPWRTWAVGVGGILGYHLLYFAAFARGPAMEVNLVNYLWPVLMVVLAPLVLGRRPGVRQLAGVLIGAVGCWQMLVHAADRPLMPGAEPTHEGVALAGAAALVWALYSLVTVRLPPFPSTAVGGFCLVSGLSALVFAALIGRQPIAVMHAVTLHQWLFIAAIGVGPLGVAFLCWDAALKRADPERIASLAYATPVLSTCWLTLSGGGGITTWQLVAVCLIVAGAVLGGSRGADRRAATPAEPQ